MDSLLVFLFLGIISSSYSLPTHTSASEGLYFWFPSPKEDGSLIKAYLTGKPGPGYRAGNIEDIRFYLYTKANPDTPDELFVGDEDSLEKSNFDKAAPLKFMTHGFGSSYNDGCSQSIKTAFLKLPQAYNVILVEWSVLAANPWYHLAVNNTKIVGERSAALIDFLVENEYTTLKDVHFLGYSLGAHVAGNAGFAVSGGKIGRVTGLDPALPIFGIATDEFRIDPTDALFVDVIHTAGGNLLEGGLSFMEARGHVDYYPNRGTKQPGCEGEAFSSCSHGRVCSYMEESILSTFEFTSCKCSTWEGFENEECLCKVKSPMGAHVDIATPYGTYYLHTNRVKPFARGDNMSPPPKSPQ